jgi:site-specific DNA-methyltransferase (adenine-specific)
MPLDSTAPGRRPSQGLGYVVGRPITAPATDAAGQWAGWGTALKPAWEPIILARKPLIGTVAANVQTYGTGAINVDGCRIAHSDTLRAPQSDPSQREGVVGAAWQAHSDAARNHAAQRASIDRTMTLGRWPANLLLDFDSAAALDAQTGERGAAGQVHRQVEASQFAGTKGDHDFPFYGDSGVASRFFYCAKADAEDRNDGCEHLEKRSAGAVTDRTDGTAGLQSPRAGAGRTSGNRNSHPTVKPTDLMRWLVRLVTPPGGVVLDPFMGSGSTGRGAVLEGARFIGIELTDEYLPIALARIQAAQRVQRLPFSIDDSQAQADTEQFGLFEAVSEKGVA